jgi:hypothetical protein
MIRNAVIVGLICCAFGAFSAEPPVESVLKNKEITRPLLLDSKPIPLGGVYPFAVGHLDLIGVISMLCS